MDERKLKYQQHKASAKQRGVDFDLSFEEWCEIWDGKFHNRGHGADQYGMLRHYDQGGYTPGNVRIGTPKENQQERSLVQKVDKSASAWLPQEKLRPTPPVYGSWITTRARVFDEYTEDEESY